MRQELAGRNTPSTSSTAPASDSRPITRCTSSTAHCSPVAACSTVGGSVARRTKRAKAASEAGSETRSAIENDGAAAEPGPAAASSPSRPAMRPNNPPAVGSPALMPTPASRWARAGDGRCHTTRCRSPQWLAVDPVRRSRPAMAAMSDAENTRPVRTADRSHELVRRTGYTSRSISSHRK